jgi:hypothetical protein
MRRSTGRLVDEDASDWDEPAARKPLTWRSSIGVPDSEVDAQDAPGRLLPDAEEPAAMVSICMSPWSVCPLEGREDAYGAE